MLHYAIQNGGCRHLELIIFVHFVHFGQTFHFISGSSRLHYCRILLIYVNRRPSYMFVQKSI